MDELSGRLVAYVGIDPAAAEKAVGIISDFRPKESSSETLRSLLAELLGTDAFPRDDAGCMGGVMGAGMRMGATGLSMGNVQSDTWKFIAYPSEKVGGDGVGEFVAVIAARAQFV
jgi:hypothetical protein